MAAELRKAPTRSGVCRYQAELVRVDLERSSSELPTCSVGMRQRKEWQGMVSCPKCHLIPYLSILSDRCAPLYAFFAGNSQIGSRIFSWNLRINQPPTNPVLTPLHPRNGDAGRRSLQPC